MIATLRGLLVLVAIAIALAIALVAIDPPRTTVTNRSLSALVRDDVDTLVFSAPGTPPLTVRRGEVQWDPTALDALRAALRGAKWHRRAAAGVAQPLRGELQVGDVRIGIGRQLAGADQAWLVIRGDAFLVDGWVARALWPDPVALRVRRPFATVEGQLVEHDNVGLLGRLQVRPVHRWINDSTYTALTRALMDIEIVALDGTRTTPQRRIRVGETEVTEMGTCPPNRVFITTTVGDGCIERAAWDTALSAFDALRLAGTQSVIDTRPAPFSPSEIVFADAGVLQVAKAQLANDPIDRERMNDLLTALATPADIVERPPGAPRSTLELRGPATVTLELYAGAIVRRGESFALKPPVEAMAVIARPASALRINVLWREDPITLTSMTVDGVTYTRGAVLGEWTREPAGTVDADLLEAVAETVATLAGPPGPAPSRVAHRLSIRITPPAGTSRTHELHLGPPGATSCSARIDGNAVQLDAADVALCAAVAALAAPR